MRALSCEQVCYGEKQVAAKLAARPRRVAGVFAPPMAKHSLDSLSYGTRHFRASKHAHGRVSASPFRAHVPLHFGVPLHLSTFQAITNVLNVQ